MPYRIRWEGHGVYRRFFGVITLAEFREANKEMRSDVRYEGIRYIISDYLEAEPAPNITERDLKAYARQERVHFFGSPDIVQAIVTTDPKNVTLARYYESLGISPYCTADFAPWCRWRQRRKASADQGTHATLSVGRSGGPPTGGEPAVFSHSVPVSSTASR